MSTPSPHTVEPPETDAQREARLTEENRLLDQAEAEAERDGTVPATEVHAWARSLLTDNPLPRPKPRHE